MDEVTRTIYITTNAQCNLRCVYCYEDKIGNEVFDLEKAQAALREELSHITRGKTLISLHGGEPFLVFDKIKELCEWSWQQAFPQKYEFFATTNGTKIHGRIKQWLTDNKHRFVCGLSLDGTRDMQNLNRTNSFDFIDIDFFVYTWPNQVVKMTVSPLTIGSMSQGVIFLFSKGFNKVDVNLADMVDWSEWGYIKTYYQELTKLSEYFKLHPNRMENCSLFSIDFNSLNSDLTKRRRWCNIGDEMNVYDVDGRKYPCHLFLENVCGKDKSQAWRTIDFNDPNEYIMGECCSCPIYPLCPTCYAANYIERGKIGLRDMNRCRLEKVRTLVVAKHQYEMLMSDNRSYDKLSQHEIRNRIGTLKAIEKIAPVLEEYQQMIDELR